MHYQAPDVEMLYAFLTTPLASSDITDGMSLDDLTEVEEEW